MMFTFYNAQGIGCDTIEQDSAKVLLGQTWRFSIVCAKFFHKSYTECDVKYLAVIWTTRQLPRIQNLEHLAIIRNNLSIHE